MQSPNNNGIPDLTCLYGNSEDLYDNEIMNEALRNIIMKIIY